MAPRQPLTPSQPYSPPPEPQPQLTPPSPHNAPLAPSRHGPSHVGPGVSGGVGARSGVGSGGRGAQLSGRTIRGTPRGGRGGGGGKAATLPSPLLAGGIHRAGRQLGVGARGGGSGGGGRRLEAAGGEVAQHNERRVGGVGGRPPGRWLPRKPW